MQAPASRSSVCSLDTSISFTEQPDSSATAAAVPAASPRVQTMGMIRMDAWASWVQEMQRPATRRFSASFGIRERYGMV